MNPLPRIHLAHLPTPIEALPRLSAQLGVLLSVKRDDQTGLALGGNKTRKLELLLAEAKANGAKTLVTAGAIQSNHCRQTAAAAARAGLDCTLVLSLPEATPIPQVYTGNTLLDALMGAQIVWAQPGAREVVFDETFERLWAEGKRPYRIPYGGSNAVGAAGYALAMQELLEQLKSGGQAQPDWIVFASSSGGTQAGLAAGQRMFGYTGRVLGISVDEPQAKLQAKAAGLAGEVCDLFGAPQRFEASEILVEDGFIGPGYGVMTDLEQQAVRLFARTEGLLLDPVYTGRAAGGMLRLIAEGQIEQRSRVLFWHTGGQPALFAERYKALGE